MTFFLIITIQGEGKETERRSGSVVSSSVKKCEKKVRATVPFLSVQTRFIDCLLLHAERASSIYYSTFWNFFLRFLKQKEDKNVS